MKIYHLVLSAIGPCLVRIDGDPLEAIQHQVLESSDLRFLAAYPHNIAPDTFGGLLTLMAKHG